MSNDFSLLVKLSADTAAFDAGLKSAAAESRQWANESKAIFEATRTKTERYHAAVNKVADAWRTGRIDGDTYGRAIKGLSDEHTGAAAAAEKLKAAGQRVFRDMMTPVEQYKARVKELREMLQAGSIDQERFNRGKLSAAKGAGLTGASDKMRTDAATVFNATRTAAERYEKQLADLNRMLRRGALDQDTHRRAVAKAQAEYRGASGAMGKLGPHLAAGLGALGIGVGIGEVVSFARSSIAASEEARLQQQKLGAVLTATGHAAGLSQKALNDYASALQQMSNFDDDAVTSAQAVLATFREIKGATFHQATDAILDLSTVMDQDLKSSALQVGKALNDPVRGITALRRAGVSFSADQEAMIKGFVETNQLAKAQAVILQELEAEFGGASKAARSELKGLANDWGNLKEAMGEFASNDAATAAVKQLASDVRGVTSDVNDLSAAIKANADEHTRWKGLISGGGLAGKLGALMGFGASGNIAAKLAEQAKGLLPEPVEAPLPAAGAKPKGAGQLSQALADGENDFASAVERATAAVEAEIRQMRMSTAEKKLDALATETQGKADLAHYAALVKKQQALQDDIDKQREVDDAKQRAKDTADEYLVRLKLEASLVGKSADEQERLRLAVAGVTEARLADIKAAQDALRAKQQTQESVDEFYALVESAKKDFEAQQAGKKEARDKEFADIAERHKSPAQKAAEKAAKEMEHLQGLVDQGLDPELAAKEQARIAREQQEATVSARQKPEQVIQTSENRALIGGTAEAFSAINRANDRKKQDKVQEDMLTVERQQLIEARKTTAAVAKNRRWGN